MPNHEFILLSGRAIPLRRLCEVLHTLADSIPDQTLRDAIAGLRKAAEDNPCSLMCSGAGLPCSRIDESMIPWLRHAVEQLHWMVEFRLEGSDSEDEVSTDLIRTTASRTPLPIRFVVGSSIIGWVYVTWTSQQVIGRFARDSGFMTMSMLVAAGIGFLWAVLAGYLLRRWKRAALIIQPLVYYVLLLLTFVVTSRAPRVLLATYALATALLGIILVFLFRRARSPTHIRERFDAFRIMANKMENVA